MLFQTCTESQFQILSILFPVGQQHQHHHQTTTTATLVPKDHHLSHLNHSHSHSPMLPPSSPMDIKPLDWREEAEEGGGATPQPSTDQMQEDIKPNSGNGKWGAFPENESLQQQQQRNFQSVFESSMVPAPSPASPAAAVSRHPSGATLVSNKTCKLSSARLRENRQEVTFT